MFIIFVIFFTSILILIMAYKIRNKKKKIFWEIKILKYILPILSFGFYGQIYLMFTTIFYCRLSESKTSPYLTCRPNHWFYKIKIIGGIAMFLHFLIAYITNTLYYKPVYLPSESDLLKKSNSLPDVIFLFTKIIIITIFILDKGVESEHWAIISFLVLVSGINAYFTLFYKNRKNKILLSLNNYFCLLLFSGFLILLIGKIIKLLNFNGGIYFFCSCFIIIFIFIIFFKSDEMDFISKDYRNIDNPDEYLQYVNSFYNIIKNKNNSRKYSTLIKSIICSIEENCVDPNCPLKKYMMYLKKDFDCEYILFQFCEKLFQYGISKFNENIFIKNQYSIFLIMEMNNKKKAIIILEGIKEEIISLEKNYNIYRCSKIIENSSPLFHKNNIILDYRKKLQKFKNGIEIITSLYYDFLTLIFESKIQKSNDFEKINKIGYEIKKLNKKIEYFFDELINIKTDNNEIINLYFEFVENILRDEKKLENCQQLKRVIYNNYLCETHEKDYSNYSLELLKENSFLQYLIVSTKYKSLGMILDCSSNLSKILGYQKNELIGNKIDILIPEMYRKKHNKILIQKTEEYKLTFLQGLYQNKIYSPNFIQKNTFCISKLKLLIPINIKIYLVNTEENELVFIVEIVQRNSLQNDLLKKINDNGPKYCVLTDKNFMIKTFTPNCITLLNINYGHINSNFNIINYIKQFKDDYLSAIRVSLINKLSQIKKTGMLSLITTKIQNKKSNKNTLSFIKKQKIKNDLFNKKYIKKCSITWIKSEEICLNTTKIDTNTKNIRLKHSTSDDNKSNIFIDENQNLNKMEIDLYMETQKIVLDNELVGYYFYFSKIPNNENISLNYKIVHEKSSKNNLETKKLKKYQLIIKPEKNFINKIKNTGVLTFNISEWINEENIKKVKKKRRSIENMSQRVKLKEDENNIIEKKMTSSKYSSTENLPEINNEEIIITEEYVPKTETNFIFNLDNISYDFSKVIDKGIILNELLKKQAMDKIKNFQKLKLINFKKINSSDTFISSQKSYSSLNSSSSLDSNSELYSDINSENENNDDTDKNEEKQITNKDSIEKKKVNINNTIFRNSLKKKSNLFNLYYKVKLDKITLMVYDFNKEAIIVDKNNFENSSKVENILNNYRNQFPIYLEKDETYPSISLIKYKKEEIKKNIIDGQKNNKQINDSKKINYKINNEKIFISKITEAINNHKDEIPIKKLKILTIISFIILISIGFANFLYNINIYSTIKELSILIRYSLYLKINNLISVYYIRELTLLNFKVDNTYNIEYFNFPDKYKNKDNYINLIKVKLVELFKDNQISMKKIFSSTLNLSKNTSKYLSEKLIDMRFLSLNYTLICLSYNIYTFLMQYSTGLYSLVFANLPLEQNLNDVFNYIHNSYNGFKDGFDLLINAYNFELNNLNKIKKINLIIFIGLVLIFLIFIIIYIFGVKYFISSNLKRVSYIEVFYSINSEVLSNWIFNCLNLLTKLKSINNEGKNNNEEEENKNIEYEYKNMNSIYKNKKVSMDNENIDKKNKKALSKINKLFMIFYGLFIILIYIYFVYISFYLYKIFKSAINISFFSNEIIKFQYNALDMFNVYREYLFDNQTVIYNMTPYEYLIKNEKSIFETIIENIININETLQPFYDSERKKGLHKFIDENYCSQLNTKYFDNYDECVKKFDKILKFDFYDFIIYFLDQIRIKKNIVKYKLENENIVGNLTTYNNDMTNILEKNPNAKFRLQLFNEENLHSEINFLFFDIILQIHKKTLILIMDLIKIKENLFVLFFLLYIIVLSLIFFTCLFPLINFLNKQIYKAKNIISILPINLLIYNNNIKSLINLFIDK